MKIGFLGLGKMGTGMVTLLLEKGHEVVGYDPYPNLEILNSLGSSFTLAESESALVSQLRSEKKSVIWMMLPAGEVTNSCVERLSLEMPAGGILIDGGNSNFNDSVANYQKCKSSNLSFLDIGTSGGIWGLEQGFCFMVGGDEDVFNYVEPFLISLAHPNGYSYLGKSGAGHYSKMVHNAIEYALMQSYGEGIDLLENGPYDYDLQKVLGVWNNGSVIRSWLLKLGEGMFEEDPRLTGLSGEISDSGTGRWSVEEALKLSIPIPLIATALFNRFRSRRNNSMSDRFIAGLRHAFGGHAVVKSDKS